MNKKIRYFLVFTLFLFTTGCVKANVSMEIGKDKSMNLTIIEAIDESLVGNYQIIGNEEIRKYEDNGFFIKKYVEDSKIGYELTKTISNIDSISSDAVIDGVTSSENLLSKDKPFFTIIKSFFKDKYKANFNFSKYKNSNIYLTEDDSFIDSYSFLSGDSDAYFELKLPYRVLSSNATSIEDDGKFLSWNLTKVSEIEFEFEIYDIYKIYIFGGIGLFVFVLFIISVISKLKKKPKIKYDPSNGSGSLLNINQINGNIQNSIFENISNDYANDISANVESPIDTKSMFSWQNGENNSFPNRELLNSNDVFASPSVQLNPDSIISNESVIQQPVNGMMQPNVVVPLPPMDGAVQVNNFPTNEVVVQQPVNGMMQPNVVVPLPPMDGAVQVNNNIAASQTDVYSNNN